IQGQGKWIAQGPITFLPFRPAPQTFLEGYSREMKVEGAFYPVLFGAIGNKYFLLIKSGRAIEIPSSFLTGQNQLPAVIMHSSIQWSPNPDGISSAVLTWKDNDNFRTLVITSDGRVFDAGQTYFAGKISSSVNGESVKVDHDGRIFELSQAKTLVADTRVITEQGEWTTAGKIQDQTQTPKPSGSSSITTLNNEQFHLKDPSVRQFLRDIEKTMNNEVFGQEEAVKIFIDSVKAKASSPSDQPIFMLAMGSTGLGKSEIFKVWTMQRYGSLDRLLDIDLGKIKSPHQLDVFFGVPAGYKGADSPGPLESFLMKYEKSGGVILFDEIGNIGDDKTEDGRRTRAEFLKNLYSILDNGRWTSPSTGRTYSLKNIEIGGTTNEGQELFQGLSKDHERLEKWSRNKNSDHLGQMLKDRYGWLEALVARLNGNIALFKPSTPEARRHVVERTLKQIANGLKNEHGFSSIAYNSETVATLAESFFVIDQGHRSIQTVPKIDFKKLITDAIIDLYESNGSPEGMAVELIVNDNFAKIKGSKSLSARSIPLTLKLTKNEQNPRFYEIDIVHRAPRVDSLDRQTTHLVRVHEAGHALVNDPLLTRRVVTLISAVPSGSAGGYVIREVTPGKNGPLHRENVIAELGTMLAGNVAEKMYFQRGSTAWSEDLETARNYATRVLVAGLSDQTLNFRIVNGKVDTSNEAFQEELKTLLREGYEFAETRLRQHWKTFRALVATLAKEPEMNRQQFEKILKENPSEPMPLQENYLRNKPKTGSGVSCQHVFN
ncbi:MAG: AAA family ATPase, partial [Bdellovibrionaceae bacterium]|nr:AAA family ATPase [Pseudobdellovibrionaceae bacterium]